MGGSLILKGAEYAVRYNLGHNVPYGPKFYRCEATLINDPWSEISNIPHGIGVLNGKLTKPIWDIIYEVLPVCCQEGTPGTLDDSSEEDV
jgi:hypothetical protein